MIVKENRRNSIDELAITKAAAWAWYERGSGFEHKLIPESDYTRKRCTSSSTSSKPSRYMLEAMKKAQGKTNHSSMLSPDHADNSLLDMYEIERISRELEYYIESSSMERRRNSIDGDYGRQKTILSPENNASGTKCKRKSNKKKGFWLRHGMACGTSRNDVVENASLVIGGRRPIKEYVPVMVGVTNFRPQAGGV